MSYGHAGFLATGPRCGCGAPAFVTDDATGAPACARCVLAAQQAARVHTVAAEARSWTWFTVRTLFILALWVAAILAIAGAFAPAP